MRINVETFLALTVLMGTGVAVGVGVMSIRDRKTDETTAAAAPTEVDATPAAKVEPVVTPAPVVTTPAPVVTAPVVTAPVPPLEPELIPDDESSYVPGPMVES